ncbi:MAG TPA: hypothetical protein VHD32_02925 [Candidatus Didemnitutus sp.]|nr:hypothetical protein [Candidatus Didemnitutus sp.]
MQNSPSTKVPSTPPSHPSTPKKPLEKSPQQAERDKTKLRQAREKIENEPNVDDTSTRSSLF